MNKETTKSKGTFWVILSIALANLAILVAIFGLMMSMNARIDSIMVTMATKADIARLEADIARIEANMATKSDKADIARVEKDLKADIARIEKDLKADIAQVEVNITEIRTLLIDHLKDGHNHHKRQSRRPASR